MCFVILFTGIFCTSLRCTTSIECCVLHSLFYFGFFLSLHSIFHVVQCFRRFGSTAQLYYGLSSCFCSTLSLPLLCCVPLVSGQYDLLKTVAVRRGICASLQNNNKTKRTFAAKDDDTLYTLNRLCPQWAREEIKIQTKECPEWVRGSKRESRTHYCMYQVPTSAIIHRQYCERKYKMIFFSLFSASFVATTMFSGIIYVYHQALDAFVRKH